jgi:hypothetical protein
MFGWLELWGMGRQEQQVDMFRHTHLGAIMLPRTVKHQHNLF